MAKLEETGTFIDHGTVFASDQDDQWHYVVFKTRPNKFGDSDWGAGRVKFENDFEPMDRDAAFAMAQRLAEEDAS